MLSQVQSRLVKSRPVKAGGSCRVALGFVMLHRVGPRQACHADLGPAKLSCVMSR